MKLSKVSKIAYSILAIGVIAIGLVIFTQTRLPAQQKGQSTNQPIPGQLPTETPTTSTFTPQEIIVLSPGQGDEWKIGETYEIRWAPSNPKDLVVIRLINLKAISSAKRLVWEASYPLPNTGTYSFTVPLYIEPGDSYQFLIIVQSEKKGYSGIFSIAR